MKISPVNYSMNHQKLSFGKFKDEKTARTVYEYMQQEANKYQKEAFYKALRDCDYITFSTDPKTGKVIGTPRTDEEFKQSELGKIAESSINEAIDWGHFEDVTGGINKSNGISIANDILNVKCELKEKQQDPEGYIKRRTPPTKEESDRFYREEKKREQEEMEDKIRTWYAQ